MNTNPIKDSGDRTNFDSGAVRDLRVGKGRMDLVPLDIANFLINYAPTTPFRIERENHPVDYTLCNMDEFIYNGSDTAMVAAMYDMILHSDVFVDAYLETAKELEVEVDLDKVAIFMSQTGGQCRASNYVALLRKALKDMGIHTITHLILGLPNETKEDMLASLRYVIASGSEGVKLQLLHVLEGTDLAEDYKAGRFSCMSLEEYANLVADCIEIIPENMVIHRFTGDGDKKILIAPLWSGDKKRVLNTINSLLRQKGF